MPDPRQTAAEMLQKVLTEKAFFSEVKGSVDSLAGKDAAFCQHAGTHGAAPAGFSEEGTQTIRQKKLPEKAAFAEFAMLLGLTEILFMETPDYAVINSWVEIVKKKSRQICRRIRQRRPPQSLRRS